MESRRSAGGRCVTSTPPMAIRPAVAASSPAMSRSVGDLPQPARPTRTRRRPARRPAAASRAGRGRAPPAPPAPARPPPRRSGGPPRGGGPAGAVGAVSFEAAAGKMLVLLGPSGCGKTTTLRLIAGLEAATAGRVAIGGGGAPPPPPPRPGPATGFPAPPPLPPPPGAEELLFRLPGRP